MATRSFRHPVTHAAQPPFTWPRREPALPHLVVGADEEGLDFDAVADHGHGGAGGHGGGIAGGGGDDGVGHPGAARGELTAAGSGRARGWLPGAGTWLTVLLAVGSAGLGFLILTTVAFWNVGGCLGGRSRPGVTGRLSGIRVFGLTWGKEGGGHGQTDRRDADRPGQRAVLSRARTWGRLQSRGRDVTWLRDPRVRGEGMVV